MFEAVLGVAPAKSRPTQRLAGLPYSCEPLAEARHCMRRQMGVPRRQGTVLRLPVWLCINAPMLPCCTAAQIEWRGSRGSIVASWSYESCILCELAVRLNR